MGRGDSSLKLIGTRDVLSRTALSSVVGATRSARRARVAVKNGKVPTYGAVMSLLLSASGTRLAALGGKYRGPDGVERVGAENVRAWTGFCIVFAGSFDGMYEAVGTGSNGAFSVRTRERTVTP
jgi:hypothetical protein